MSSSKELLSYRLELLKINEVRPHEEVKIRNLSEIMNSIKQIGLQLDPVIVDEKTNVALDGMHRIKAIRELQLKRIMVARVDYSDPKIGLERWLRAIKSPSISKIEELKVALKLKRVESTTAAMEMVDSGESSIALITEKMGLVSSIRRSGIEATSIFQELLNRMAKKMMPAGSLYAGRVYNEPLVLYNP